MATNTSEDVGRIGLGHIAIRKGRVNFKSRHMPLSSSMSTAKPSKSAFISPTACSKQSNTRMVSFIPSCMGVWFQEKLTSILFDSSAIHNSSQK
ncbi:hypothetical protein TNCV_5088431 [Trichonephila clavipes]|nr:hypothetical protein TNCV_5088431 [Trichonephila clavipes]